MVAIQQMALFPLSTFCTNVLYCNGRQCSFADDRLFVSQFGCKIKVLSTCNYIFWVVCARTKILILMYSLYTHLGNTGILLSAVSELKLFLFVLNGLSCCPVLSNRCWLPLLKWIVSTEWQDPYIQLALWLVILQL